jgi:uncharacterized protein (DUF924 family)
MHEAIRHILDFWFGPLDAAGMSDPDREKRWFRGGADIDRHCREHYTGLVESAVAGGLTGWSDSAEGLLARVLLLDQFTRNIYRGTPAAFAGDELAIALARDAVATGRDRGMPTIHRVFLYVPYEHSEQLAIQDEGVALFDELLASSGQAVVAGYRDYAIAHRDVIARFGRFPHRNAILGRESSPEELAHLRQHGGF